MQFKESDLKPLREKDNSQYTPEDEEIAQYAAYIGVELPDEDYMWELAKEGVMASLPPGWQACQTPDGELVYRNVETKKVQEQHPMDQVYRKRVIELRQAYNKYEEEEHDLNTIPEEKSSEKSIADHSDLDDLITPTIRQLPVSSSVLQQESTSLLNYGLLYPSSFEYSVGSKLEESKLLSYGSKDVQKNQNGQKLIDERDIEKKEKERERYKEIEKEKENEREKEREKQQQMQRENMKKNKEKLQLQCLLKQQELCKKLLAQLIRDNERRTQKVKRKLLNPTFQKKDKKTKQKK